MRQQNTALDRKPEPAERIGRPIDSLRELAVGATPAVVDIGDLAGAAR
jgi:hypothetical protein